MINTLLLLAAYSFAYDRVLYVAQDVLRQCDNNSSHYSHLGNYNPCNYDRYCREGRMYGCLTLGLSYIISEGMLLYLSLPLILQLIIIGLLVLARMY